MTGPRRSARRIPTPHPPPPHHSPDQLTHASKSHNKTTSKPLERSRHEIEIEREPSLPTSKHPAGAEVEVDPGACGRCGRQRGVRRQRPGYAELRVEHHDSRRVAVQLILC